MTVSQDPEKIRDAVRAGYAQVAVTASDDARSLSVGCCGPTSGCGTPAPSPEAFAAQLGYSPEELQALPEGANLGLSCGNPTAIAALQPGQVVLDLGSGAGFDCFLAAPKVGAQGRVIGVDMTPEMLSRARRNLASYRERSGLDNVEFRLGEIEHLPVADRSVDVLLSNCVINLSADKPQVWREVGRVLRPGGRVAVSDVALLRPLPQAVADMVEALVGCVAGAELVSDYRAMVEAAGLTEVEVTQRPEFVETLASSEDPLFQRIAAELPEGASVADYVTSVEVVAHQPDVGCGCGPTCCAPGA